MELLKIILDWTASISWPLVVLVISIMFKAPILELLSRFGDIADRASREPFDIQLGEKIKISFKEAIERANPKTAEEAVKIAEREVDKAISIYEMISKIPMKQHHKDLLLKIAKGGDEGIEWFYGGPAEQAPGKTMGFLLTNALVRREGNIYKAHPLIREYIFAVHSDKNPNHALVRTQTTLRFVCTAQLKRYV